jgi:hypothetical protein
MSLGPSLSLIGSLFLAFDRSAFLGSYFANNAQTTAFKAIFSLVDGETRATIARPALGLSRRRIEVCDSRDIPETAY